MIDSIRNIFFKTTQLKSWVVLLFRFILSVVFGASVYLKFKSFYSFCLFISSVANLDIEDARLVALFLQSVEFYLCFQFISSPSRRDIFVAVLLMGLYNVILFYILFQNQVQNCFCFGTFLELTPVESLIKNVILSYFIFIVSRNTPKPSVDEDRNRIKYEFVAFFIVLLGCLYIFDQPKDYFTDVTPLPINANEVPKKRVLFLDVREPFLYKLAHIEGSINIPYRGEAFTSEELKKLDGLLQTYQSHHVIVYCDNSLCGLARSFTYRFLEHFSRQNVFYLDGGLQEWKDSLVSN